MLISFDIDFVINPIETPTLKVPVRILLKIRWLSSGNVSQRFLISKFFFSSLSFDNAGIVSLSNLLRLIFDNFLSFEVVLFLSNNVITSQQNHQLLNNMYQLTIQDIHIFEKKDFLNIFH